MISAMQKMRTESSNKNGMFSLSRNVTECHGMVLVCSLNEDINIRTISPELFTISFE